MNFILENYNWLLILVALISGGMLAWPALKQAQGHALGTAEAVTLINRQKGVLIDVGTEAEYAQGHAAGAKSIPLAELATSRALPKNKTLPVIVLCPTGNRASKALAVLKQLGYENGCVLAGGTRAWRQANLPIEKQEKTST